MDSNGGDPVLSSDSPESPDRRVIAQPPLPQGRGEWAVILATSDRVGGEVGEAGSFVFPAVSALPSPGHDVVLPQTPVLRLLFCWIPWNGFLEQP